MFYPISLSNFFAVSSSPVDVPQIKYGMVIEKAKTNIKWSWSNISSPIFKCSDKVFYFLLRCYQNLFLRSILFYMFRIQSLDFGCRLDLCCPLSSAVYWRSQSRMLVMVQQKVKLLWFLTHGYLTFPLFMRFETCFNLCVYSHKLLEHVLIQFYGIQSISFGLYIAKNLLIGNLRACSVWENIF